jgi:hypothetical protein
VLARDISPNNTISEAAQNVMGGLFTKLKEAAPEEIKALQHEAGSQFGKLFHLYQGHEPLEAEKAAHAFKHMVQEALLEDPKQAKTLASQKLSTWLKQANEGWRNALEQPIEAVIDNVATKFEETVSEGKRMKPLNLGKQPLITLAKENWSHLIHFTEQEGGLQKIGGKLAPMLEPMMQLSHRFNMTRGFLDRRNVFMGIQVAFISALQAVLVGQLMMVLVFNTFARMDHDFDPTRFKNKKKLYKEQHNPKAEPSSSPSKAGGATKSAALSQVTPLPTDVTTTTPLARVVPPASPFTSPFLSSSVLGSLSAKALPVAVTPVTSSTF